MQGLNPICQAMKILQLQCHQLNDFKKKQDECEHQCKDIPNPNWIFNINILCICGILVWQLTNSKSRYQNGMEKLQKQDYHEESGVGVILDHDVGVDDGVHQDLLLALGEWLKTVQYNTIIFGQT